MNNTYLHNAPFKLESGFQFEQVTLAYNTLGKLNEAKNNVVWICHALTGNSDPLSWWSGMVGSGKTFDPAKHFIICANVLGSCYGTTGPFSLNPATGKKYYHSFPNVTVRDIVDSLELLRKHLELDKINFLVGGSLGGQQAVEWAIKEPSVIENLILLATNAKHSSWGIAFNESQRQAIEVDTTWKDKNEAAGLNGLAVARSIALLSYRNYETYQETQIDDNEKTDNYKASSYQRYQGQKFINRFNAFSYWTLSKAMDSHDVSRGRESISNALGLIKAKTLVIGITTDVLFPVAESLLMSQYIKNSKLSIIGSIYGHDGFLIEAEQINKVIKETFSFTEK